MDICCEFQSLFKSFFSGNERGNHKRRKICGTLHLRRVSSQRVYGPTPCDDLWFESDEIKMRTTTIPRGVAEFHACLVCAWIRESMYQSHETHDRFWMRSSKRNRGMMWCCANNRECSDEDRQFYQFPKDLHPTTSMIC